MARPAPTRTASSTRGRRSCSSTAVPVASRPPDTCPAPRTVPIRSSRVRTTAPGGSGNAPIQTPVRTAATSASSAPPSTRAGRRRGRTGTRSTRASSDRVLPVVTVIVPTSSAGQRLGDRLGEVGHPGTPAGGDVVVRLEHPALLDCGQRVERRPLGEGLRGLVAADGIGEDDEIGGLADDVFGG